MNQLSVFKLRPPKILPAALALMSILALIVEPVYAKPPPWAPAHGYRHKHEEPLPEVAPEPVYRAPPPVIEHGRCNREAIGAILGGTAGAALGSRVGEGGARAVATIAGGIIGFIIGREIGRSMDESDRYCMGNALEYAADGAPVGWYNPALDTRYTVTPLNTFQNDGRRCRKYSTVAAIDGGNEKVVGTACRQPDGTWKVVN